MANTTHLYHAAMQDGQAEGMDRSLACPFLGLAEDRGTRFAVPDRRHRCFADREPSPRAIAHQQQYCLQATFAVCPTFQDWARHESARVAPEERPSAILPADGGAGRAGSGTAPEERPAAGVQRGGGLWEDAGGWSPAGEWQETASDPDEPPSPRRAGAEASGAGRDDAPHAAPDVPPFLAARRDRMALGVRQSPEGRVAAAGTVVSPGDRVPGDRTGDRPGDRSRAERPRRGVAWEEPALPRRSSSDPDADVPDWERPARREAYPTLHVPARLPNVSVLWLGLAALILAAFVLFLAPTVLPGLFGVAPAPTPFSTPTPVASASAAAVATPVPAPTPIVYTVVQGDTLSAIASKYGLTIAQILKANPQIKNPNSLSIGDRVNIPTPAPAAPASGAP